MKPDRIAQPLPQLLTSCLMLPCASLYSLGILKLVLGRSVAQFASFLEILDSARAGTVIGIAQPTCRKSLMTATFVVLAVTGRAVEATEPAAASGLYVDVGLAGIFFDTDASIKAAGSQLPGSNLRASNNVALGLGIGYFITPDVSLLAVLGVPPTTTLSGQGTLSGLTLGKVTYGPSMLVANYHFRQLGAFQPFLGAGITYTVVFGTKDDAIANLRVSNSIGAVIRAGADVMFSDRWGAFLSLSKVFVSTNASGNAVNLGGAPVSAHVSFNPLVLFTGVTYRF